MRQHPQNGIATPPPAETQRRNVNLIVRATPYEKSRVQTLADEAGQSVSDYIRQRIGL